MKASLSIKLGQQLTLTPALRQAIRLLTLSAAELESEINLALESNPLLERAEETEAEEPAEESPGTYPPSDAETTVAAGSESHAAEPVEETADWEIDGSHGAGGAAPADQGPTHELADAADDLRDHLLWQLHLSPLGERERRIGMALIEAVGDDGYLSETLDAIAASLLPEIHAGIDEISALLHLIQRFDPVGAACSNLAECLHVQLSVLSPDTPGLELARQIAAGHLEELARHGPEHLARQWRESTESMEQAVALLRSLDPRPGGQIGAKAPDYVVPDCVVYRHGGIWKVALVSDPAHALSISRHYESLIGKSSGSDAAYLRGRLQEARWLIRSLQTRSDTVLRVAQAIVRQQSAFLEFGAEAMRPLTLREIAEELGLHESTISRTTTRKYLDTPRGAFEFKHFFASGVANDCGGAASSTAIQAMIRRLVEAEDPRKPMSDARLAARLKGDGVPVARRTVAKYREALRIPPSHERQRL